MDCGSGCSRCHPGATQPPDRRRQRHSAAGHLSAGNRHDVTQTFPLVETLPKIKGVVGMPRQKAKRLYAGRGYDFDKTGLERVERLVLAGVCPCTAMRAQACDRGGPLSGRTRAAAPQITHLVHFEPPLTDHLPLAWHRSCHGARRDESAKAVGRGRVYLPHASGGRCRRHASWARVARGVLRAEGESPGVWLGSGLASLAGELPLASCPDARLVTWTHGSAWLPGRADADRRRSLAGAESQGQRDPRARMSTR